MSQKEIYLEHSLFEEVQKLIFCMKKLKLTNLHFPGGPGVRIDSAAFAGMTVNPHYDSLLAKLVVSRRSREVRPGRW